MTNKLYGQFKENISEGYKSYFWISEHFILLQ